MVRKPRLLVPGGIYHVIQRGVERRDIFLDEKDYDRFYQLMAENVERYDHRFHAFCLMRNHIHLAVQIGEDHLGDVMRNLLFRYAGWFNKRHQRSGHLYQGRYKAILVDGDAYLQELVRYIHLNPVRADICRGPHGYPHSSHRSYLGKRELPWLATDFVLAQFDKNRNAARRKFDSFVRSGINKKALLDFKRGNSKKGEILGTDTFIAEVLKKGNQRPIKKWELDDIVAAVCRLYEIDLESVQQNDKNRRRSEARAMMGLLQRERGNESLSALARRLNRSMPAVGQAAARLEQRMASDRQVNKRYQQLVAVLDGEW